MDPLKVKLFILFNLNLFQVKLNLRFNHFIRLRGIKLKHFILLKLNIKKKFGLLVPFLRKGSKG